MHVVLGSRSLSRGEKAVAEVIASQPSAEGRLDLLELDVTSDKSVAAAVETVKAKYPEPLFGLCNNAGVGECSVGLDPARDLAARLCCRATARVLTTLFFSLPFRLRKVDPRHARDELLRHQARVRGLPPAP